MKDDEGARTGRPRSEQARVAVLNAVDDLLREVGYASMTMKGIAERAGVGRQTVYRWWSNKAEILLEASLIDAGEELAVMPTGDRRSDVVAYLKAVRAFLTDSDAGNAYRVLVAAAQQDPAVAELLAGRDPVAVSAARAFAGVGDDVDAASRSTIAAAVGPLFFSAMTGGPMQSDAELTRIAAALVDGDRA